MGAHDTATTPVVWDGLHYEVCGNVLVGAEATPMPAEGVALVAAARCSMWPQADEAKVLVAGLAPARVWRDVMAAVPMEVRDALPA